MEIISTSAAAVAILVALLSTHLISNKIVTPSPHGRFLTIDGLRGYLAFFVFLHHSCIWYYYLKSGVWVAPPSQLFVHFGQAGVALFFMITGFLFFSKLLDDRDCGVDWLRLYVSRFLRLTPLYVFSIFLLLLIVWILTKNGPAAPTSEIITSIIKWLSFTIFGAANVNGFTGTNLINAGVTWSLPYEWFFYMVLPIIAFVIGIRPPAKYVIISALSAVAFSFYYLGDGYYWLFLGGIVAAILVRSARFRKFAVSKLATLLVATLVIYTVANYSSVYGSSKAKFFLTIAFCLIAGGNSIFGTLKSKLSRAMGEMAYSIYLLHGILLFVIFNFVIGTSLASKLTPIQYWGVIVLLTPFLILVCGITFRLIEKPAIKKTGVLTEWIRAQKITHASHL
ncbi:acyltransferase family protein [Pseudomonas sp. GG8]